jgi:hypothetical protein
VDLTLNAEYERTVGRNAVSQLPPVSVDVQNAFPDRYRRDAEGRLYEIDARLVSFARGDNERIRWGANFKRSFGVPKAPPRAPGQPNIVFGDLDTMDLTGAGWRISGNFTHTWLLTSTRLARAGLPEVDLLSGGTAGYNAASRHNVQSRLGMAHNGTGLQLNLNWKSASRISSGTTAANDIVFSPFLRMDVSAFTELGNRYPGNPLLKGVRVSLNIDNLLDSKQRVQDQNGDTPLRYQPYLLNPTGRVIGLAVRKSL